MVKNRQIANLPYEDDIRVEHALSKSCSPCPNKFRTVFKFSLRGFSCEISSKNDHGHFWKLVRNTAYVPKVKVWSSLHFLRNFDNRLSVFDPILIIPSAGWPLDHEESYFKCLLTLIDPLEGEKWPLFWLQIFLIFPSNLT